MITKELFDKWESKYPDKCFVYDGIVNLEEWGQQKLKICFLLKEAYTEDEKNYFRWSLSEWLNDEIDSVINTWDIVPLWVYGILNTTETSIASYPGGDALDKNTKHNLLKRIAAVNVKKAGGSKNSDWYDLVKYAVDDKEFLKEQLETINPDVILCGSTYDFLRVVYGATYDAERKRIKDDGKIPNDFTDKGFFIMNDKTIVIKYYHPQNHFPSKVNYYAVCAIYQQALKELNSCTQQ